MEGERGWCRFMRMRCSVSRARLVHPALALGSGGNGIQHEYDARHPARAFHRMVSRLKRPLAEYADLREEAGERLVDIFDPGLPAETKCDLVRAMADTTLGEGRKTGLFTMSWDAVCQAFEAVHLNWNPVLKPVSVKKHWYVFCSIGNPTVL